MPKVYSQREMETLSTTLGKKKKAPVRTQGKVAPVTKRDNPFLKPARGGGTSPTSPSLGTSALAGSNNLAGMLAQAKPAAPVTTDFTVNYESDPTLARIKALGSQNVANAKTEAEALRKQAIIDTGLTDVGTEIGVDATTLAAANANPFSTRAVIEKTALDKGRALDESLNQQNLFYSGHRGTQLSDLARVRAEQEANATRDLRGVLGGISGGVLEAEQAAAAEEQRILEEIAGEERQNIADKAYIDSLTAALAPAEIPEDPLASSTLSTELPNQFISEATGLAAGVSPYNYDPYEEELAMILAMNPIYGNLMPA